MTKTTVRVLVVDDYQAWHRFVAKTLQNTGNFQVVREVGDGVEAVREAEELQPDLVLLDIGLPSMNGLEAARRIRQVSPNAKILFVSENRSRDIHCLWHPLGALIGQGLYTAKGRSACSEPRGTRT